MHKPKLLVWKDCEDFDMNAALQTFFDGVGSHEEGNKVWTAALDESICAGLAVAGRAVAQRGDSSDALANGSRAGKRSMQPCRARELFGTIA